MALNSNFRTLTADNIEGIVEDRNYLKSSFENGTITGWTEVSVALTSGLPTGTPTISSTAASSLALSATSVTPLSGSRSLLVDVPSALTAGHGFISDEFTLDRMDLGKVLTVTFDYERVTGTYNFSGTLGSQTWMVYIYDATLGAANWIQPAGFLGMNQSSGPGRVRATFQSSVTAGQKYRVAVIASQAAASASSIEFDNFTASRQTAPIGPVVTDWVSYTPTGSWVSGATYTGKYRRVGDSIQCSVKIATTGAVTATDLQVSIPPGFTIDTTKMASADFLQSTFGAAHGFRTAGTHYNFQIAYASPTLLFFTYQNQLTGQVVSITNTVPFTWANGDAIHATFMVPVSGWSSNVQLSNDTDTRVVAAAYLRSTAQSIPAATDTTVIYDTRRIDTHAAMNTSNGRFYAPVSGVYRISASVFYNFFVPAAGNPLQMRFLKRNAAGTIVEDAYKDNVVANAAVGQEFALRTSSLFSCNAGETLEVVLWQNTGAARTTIGNINFVEIERLSGPSVVAASETVAAHYSSSAGQSIPNAVQTVVVFSTKTYDTHGIYNSVSGVGTIPISGKFRITAHVLYNSTSWGVGTTSSLWVQKNGVTVSALRRAEEIPAAVTRYLNLAGSATLSFNAGDTFTIMTDHNRGASTAMFTDPVQVYFSIERVGN